jgi:putative methanogen marker protein 4
MSLMDLIKSKEKGKSPKVGIGLGRDFQQNALIVKAVNQFLENEKATIYLFSEESGFNNLNNISMDIKLIKAENVEAEIFNFVESKQIESVIRGSLSSSKFINEVKTRYNTPNLNRLALLETVSGFQFFFAPVGIDECSNLKEKQIFIENAIKFLTSIGIDPKVSILSGGREGDKGRDKVVDASLEESHKLIEHFNQNYPYIKVYHDEILIENAITRKSNLIIAPDGISGNLVYRTLVHLGGGKAYGAIYLGLKTLIIDTSRVGNTSEIEGALRIAKAFSDW